MLSINQIIEFHKNGTQIYTVDTNLEEDKIFVFPCIVKDYKLAPHSETITLAFDNKDDSVACGKDELFETVIEAYEEAIELAEGYVKDKTRLLIDAKNLLVYLIGQRDLEKSR
jgi:hypothetical protein